MFGTERKWGRPALGAAAALSAALTLSACATGPVYRPRGPGQTVGYTDQQLTPKRYRVTFDGGTGTTRENVENYLLRRASEVTEKAGYRYFKFDTRDTHAETFYQTTFMPSPAFGYGYAPAPYYWSNFAFGPSMVDGQSVPITRYQAYSEIVMLTAAQAQNDPQAIDAQAVLARLGSKTPAASAPPAAH